MIAYFLPSCYSEKLTQIFLLIQTENNSYKETQRNFFKEKIMHLTEGAGFFFIKDAQVRFQIPLIRNKFMTVKCKNLFKGNEYF